ncbi:MAG: DsbA family protein [Thermodesulfobacteriota bacterium]
MRKYKMSDSGIFTAITYHHAWPYAILAFLFIVFSALTTQAEISITKSKSFKVNENIIDLASSVDGKYIFVLSRGKIQIFDSEGNKSGTLKVDPCMTDIAVSGLSAAKIENKIFLSSVKTGMIKEIKYSFIAEIDTEGSPFLGTTDAPVSIVLFSDFQCPYCSRLHSLLEKLVEENQGKVKVVYKHFPLRTHKKAKFAALAAIAAHNQGKFWTYHDKLFQNSSSLNPATFKKIAEELNLDLKQFKEDYQSLETRKKVEQDIKSGHEAGVRGTPTLFVNGRKVQNRTFQGIQDMINEELATEQKNSSTQANSKKN